MLAPRTEYWDERLGRNVGPLDPAYDPERFGALVASGSADAATRSHHRRRFPTETHYELLERP
jgi:hypothetical protein